MTTTAASIFAAIDIARLTDLIDECHASAIAAGLDADADYTPTAEDCDWVVSQLPRRPTREEWADAGLPDIGGAHVLDVDALDITPGHVTQVWSGTPDLDAYVSVDVTVEGETASVGCTVGIPESDHGSAIASGSYASYHTNTADYVDASDWQHVGAHLRDAVIEALHQASNRLLQEAQEMGIPAQD